MLTTKTDFPATLQQLTPEKRELIEQINGHVQHATSIRVPPIFLTSFVYYMPRAPRLTDSTQAWREHAERISTYCDAYKDLVRASQAFTACVEQNQSGRVH